MSPGEFEEKMRWIFSFFDKDGDGVVTVDELKELLNEIKDKNNLISAGIITKYNITYYYSRIQTALTSKPLPSIHKLLPFVVNCAQVEVKIEFFTLRNNLFFKLPPKKKKKKYSKTTIVQRRQQKIFLEFVRNLIFDGRIAN